MSKIRVKNFGPIKESDFGGDGFIEIKRFLVFIGDQGTGKSTIAKLISTLTWIEKALMREDISIKEVTKPKRFRNAYCQYQNIHNYFKTNSEIDYVGNAFDLTYRNEEFMVEEKSNGEYQVPKIMYVPAERNFLSAIKGVKQMKNLPGPLITFLDEYNYALESFEEKIDLPIKNVSLEYQKLNDHVSLSGNGFKIALSEASSGYQSLTPLYVVSKYLSEFIKKGGDSSRNDLSAEQIQRIRKILANRITKENNNIIFDKAFLDSLATRFTISYFFNIVEEIEQNLFPTSQKHLLFKLLEFANESSNKLLLTTHSPYIINYLTLSTQARQLRDKLNMEGNIKLLRKLDKIVPLKSTIDQRELEIYEINNEGKIKKLKFIDDIPSDDNYLNNLVEEINVLFSQLLTIENESKS
ncbi:MAG: hypothetical protein CL605_09475 [Altibacter sp.]|uniref:AAA family ATPase n=1 Tax=Altibacter sp. TaxID=2024823 RepID=UPI000C93D1FE|nr:AAA family ATPase [Altibacter sp.]MAP55119.1 hypothetical protein [Altibacter sp.]|tara:strand:- start:7 stop:1239 length:1233 start_codon:yes stop_codon:yes gene_type:complete